ncbi:hypothetical protein PV387_03445 [Streptomyces sp. ME02-6987-2C]|uniref:hypothetical protein n=1 Tax=unclassified Streptomyces TaxID=2593676 RepID=UPI0029A8A064|nr:MULTISPECIES: hypothetical protein [unclassified Streptomyces]MDX3345894.1 hypothetical protein [Streptomyces sp. ME02-6979A]MDX3365089.1 hypothetical protein [Streptomyces sp. ME02-6987-2C]MDX3404856.1 hypothetical protein [Streptomyces sp. ME02-6977A]MDX3421660.1 hypothetical protein [Streptomyces sp. ME02-6985-2c]
MAEPVFLTEEATPQIAGAVVDLIEAAGAAATDHFDQLPADEEASVFVTLTGRTTWGTIPLGMWNFLRAADGTVSLNGATVEAVHG